MRLGVRFSTFREVIPLYTSVMLAPVWLTRETGYPDPRSKGLRHVPLREDEIPRIAVVHRGHLLRPHPPGEVGNREFRQERRDHRQHSSLDLRDHPERRLKGVGRIEHALIDQERRHARE